MTTELNLHEDDFIHVKKKHIENIFLGAIIILFYIAPFLLALVSQWIPWLNLTALIAAALILSVQCLIAINFFFDESRISMNKKDQKEIYKALSQSKSKNAKEYAEWYFKQEK